MASIPNTTPELSDVIRTIVDAMLLDVNVCLPAKVTAYDPNTQYADVKVQLYQKLITNELVEYPVIPNVPVKHPKANAGAARIHMPISVGDDVLLVFSQRSIDNWKSQGGLTDPNDPRKHHITDAFCLIGGSALPDSFTVTDPTAIEIVNENSTVSVGTNQVEVLIGETTIDCQTDKVSVTNGDANITLNSNGTFKFGTSAVDFIKQVQSGFQTLSEDTTNTFLGPQPLNDFETYAEIATKINTLIG